MARGLPEMPPEEIKTELESQSINCVKVIPLRKKENAPTGSPIYLVDFPNNTDLKAVRNIRYIGYIRVHWERYRNRRKATQCHRCQQFGHGTAYCKNAPQCVKCDQPHLTQDCLKKREEPPKCVNCEGNHPANYSKCPAYLNHLERIKYRHQPTTAKHTIRPVVNSENFPALPTQKSRDTPARAIWKTQAPQATPASKRNTMGQELSDLNELMTEMDRLNQICNIGKLLNLVKDLNNKLAHCTNDLDRLYVFYTVMDKNGGK